jgi:hypothetical protein
MSLVSRPLLLLSLAMLAAACAGDSREQRAVEDGASAPAASAAVGTGTGVSILGGAAVGAAGGAVGDYVFGQNR